jgi:hypothetical protein
MSKQAPLTRQNAGMTGRNQTWSRSLVLLAAAVFLLSLGSGLQTGQHQLMKEHLIEGTSLEDIASPITGDCGRSVASSSGLSRT